MFRATGFGKIESHADFVTAGVLKAELYNFDFDDFEGFKFRGLKTEHQNYLKDQVVPLLKNAKGNIWMQGTASRIGTTSWNMELSRNRVLTVANFLGLHGIDAEQMQTDAIGNEQAHRALDDERDRGVLIWVYPRFQFDPPPPRHVPAKTYLSRHFKISMVTGLSISHTLQIARLLKLKIGAGLAFDGIIFMIWDTNNNVACLYVYIGIGLGVGLAYKAMPNVAATTHGPWTSFVTEKQMHCWQFGRWARFTSAGVANQSVSWITMETPKGIDNVDSLSINTGTTLGAGMSSTVGDIIRATQPMKFFGP